jgi:hypothetical protein
MEVIAKKQLVETSAAHIEASRTKQRTLPRHRKHGSLGIDRESDSRVHPRAHNVAKPHHGP